MPIYEVECPECRSQYETYLRHFEDQNPECPTCNVVTERLVSKSNVIFTGPLSASKYNDKNLEFADSDGHWGHRKKSRRPGEPEWVWIDSWEKRKKFMKDEGLVGVEDVGQVEATVDGKWGSSTGSGTKGQWI